MAASNGGTTAPLNLVLLTSSAAGSNLMFTFDPTNFNDPNNGSSYSFKVEDIIAGRQGTINRVIVSYRDLGQATFTAFLSGANDAGNTIMSAIASVAIGSVAAPGTLKTVLVGISLTGLNLQLTIARAPNAGPVSITKVRMEGKVETTTY